MYRSTTHQIDVEVEPFYLPERSTPEDGRHVWGYRVTIINNSSTHIQLMSRYWRITDAAGRVEEVRGAGVVGEQPELNPGDSFQYSSGCPLRTSSGFMVGSYTMRDGDGNVFEVAIPAFSLDLPNEARSVN
ncbi:Co2+/Mg2+ efflux protein ApaG [Mesorhizobium sp. CAU 1741]|uniref:Co2+/Mg2+ efflux protein ApaG n=1 Tax=Mesorhizobium sp. CAU 1741 TaxID=3140366 RepID=UPI00325AFAD2